MKTNPVKYFIMILNSNFRNSIKLTGRTHPFQIKYMCRAVRELNPNVKCSDKIVFRILINKSKR